MNISTKVPNQMPMNQLSRAQLVRSVLAVAAAVALVACSRSGDAPGSSVDAARAQAAAAPGGGGGRGAGGGSAAVRPAAPGGGSGSAAPADVADAEPAPTGHDFIAEARTLFRVAACGDGDVPAGFDAAVVDKYCAAVRRVQDTYNERWTSKAKPFFDEHRPANLPKKVVYPFAGGDLATALTVFPDADEITTISLEPAGDPRSIDALRGKDLQAALDKQRKQLKFLYTVDFSNTIDLIDSMRGGKLPGQLIFSLSALRVHGYVPVSLHYFTIEADGSLHYLTDDDIAKSGDPNKAVASHRNFKFGNMELRFTRPGDGHVRIYRHIRWNLDNDHLKDDRLLKHLAAKGQVAGMTKAASYLLSWDTFSKMRNYLLGHVTWMVSDATGIPPTFARPAGFTQETYGTFDGPHMSAGHASSKAWRTLWKSQPTRELQFRFGYPDSHKHRHLVITYKAA